MKSNYKFILIFILILLVTGCQKKEEEKLSFFPSENVKTEIIQQKKKTEDTTTEKTKGFVYDENNLDYKLVWSDEFDYEGAPDSTKWGYDIGGHGWGNNELQYYTEGDNVKVIDGKLIIEARKEERNGKDYTSTRLITKGKGDWLYGVIEVKAKLPKGLGTWPAIWMLPTDWKYGGWPESGEIDVMEHVGYEMNKVHGSIHTKSYYHKIGTQKSGQIMVDNVDTEYHVYKVEWLPDKIKFFVDDELYYEFNPSKLKTAPTYKEWPFDQKFHLLMNIAVGGDWGGAKGVDESIWPQTMEVDYVRVYQSDVINQLATNKDGGTKKMTKAVVNNKKIIGVNLGGWLVLEKWMTPALFAGHNAEDEYNLLKSLGDKAPEVLKQHRDTFITEEDFQWLKNVGVNTVRVPIGHWLFDGGDPYTPCIEYLDWAMEMGEKYEIDVLVDVHAAKGCQNGFDNGGLSNIMEWHKYPENVDNTVELVGRICDRYKDSKAFSGIQLLNEPRWDVPMDILRDYYIRGYREARKYISEDKYIIFHDGFRLKQWKDFMQEDEFVNVILDTHMYHVFEEEDAKRDVNQHIHKAAILRQQEIDEMKEYFPIVVGEWSIGIHDVTLKALKDDFLQNSARTAIGNAQLITYSSDAGWFFWNYKLSEESRKTHRGWDFRDCVEFGWLPKSFN